MVRTWLVGMVGALALGGAEAGAATFSFASDSNANQWTLTGTAGQAGMPAYFDIASPLTTPILFEIDDDNDGPLNKLSVSANLVVSLRARFASSNLLFGSTFQHTYAIDGIVQFVNPANAADVWLSILVGTSAGAPSLPGFASVNGGAGSWGTAGLVIGSSAFSSTTFVASLTFQQQLDVLAAMAGQGANSASYGVQAGATPAGTGFAFDLTVINQGPATGTTIGPEVILDPTLKLPTTSWRAESSFSGVAVIPAPGAAAIVGLGGVALGRRRRN